MAININLILTTEAGSPVNANSMLKPKYNFGTDILGRDEDGDYDGSFTRTMVADLSFLYVSKAAFQADEANVVGIVQEFTTEYKRAMSEQDYLDISDNGGLAEQWVIEHLNSILGAGVCTYIDPFEV